MVTLYTVGAAHRGTRAAEGDPKLHKDYSIESCCGRARTGQQQLRISLKGQSWNVSTAAVAKA